MEKENIKPPNIFDFAPSELTQDAFICWLCKWSNPKFNKNYKALNELGNYFINSMLDKHEVSLNSNPKVVGIKRQAQGVIDILIELENHVILIEDKVYTKEHTKQLDGYKEIVEGEFPNKTIIPIYFQTGIQSNYDEVGKAGYKIFDRKDFLKILDQGDQSGIKNDIYLSFYGYLKNMDKRFESFGDKKIENWDWEGWQGFFTVLQQNFDGNWSYVSNPSGGFMAFWWSSESVDDCTVYMQLEDENLCYKISVEKKENNYSKLRNFWHKKIIKASNDSELSIIKPSRFGHGETMTVAVLQEDYRVTGSGKILDQEKTIDKLRNAEKVLKKAIGQP
jgi:hypothetical protein